MDQAQQVLRSVAALPASSSSAVLVDPQFQPSSVDYENKPAHLIPSASSSSAAIPAASSSSSSAAMPASASSKNPNIGSSSPQSLPKPPERARSVAVSRNKTRKGARAESNNSESGIPRGRSVSRKKTRKGTRAESNNPESSIPRGRS